MKESNKILFTVVTVCFNSEKSIEKTIQSILNQDTNNYEYLIIDGYSTDFTVDIIKKNEKLFNGKMSYISEKDSGIYNAMNKAIKLAKGEYIIFINSEDTLEKNVLSYIEHQLRISNYPDLIYGNSISVYQINENIITKEVKSNINITCNTLKRGMGVVHQSIFTRNDVFMKIGGFNETYKIGADWDFLIRSTKANLRINYVDKAICRFDRSGISAKPHNIERHIIRKNNLLYTSRYDMDFIQDIFSLENILRHIIGQKGFLKLQYYYNRIKQNKIASIRRN